MIEVELPDGSVAEFPDGTSPDVIKGALRKRFAPEPAPERESQQSKDLRSELSAMTQNPAAALYEQRPEWQKPLIAASDMLELGMSGATMGFGDKLAAGLRSAATDETYDQSLQKMRQKTQNARDRAGWAGTVAEVGGGVVTPAALASKGVTLAGRLGTSAMTGAKGAMRRAGLLAVEGAGYGGLSAAGNDTDIGTGVLIGGLTGGAIPLAAEGARAVAKPVVDAVRARVNPAGYASQKVAERVGDTMPMAQAERRMAANPGAALADVGGENARTLLRTAANVPGPAKSAINARLTMRQFGQGDRIKAAVTKTFADPEGYLAAKDEIAAEAQRLAKPLYEAAYSQPVHFSEKLESILQTPAGKSALRKAQELAANEGIPFKQLFVNIADDGSAAVRRVPDTRGWDYIKRAMDDMIDGQTDAITRKVTNEGRILTNLKNDMLSEVDKVNPVYKAARQAWGGQAKLDNALEAGREVFRSSPEAFKRTVEKMTEAEKASARVGAAEAIRQQIDAAGLTNNAVLRVFSKPSQVKNLSVLFESPEKFAEFRKSIFAEARKRATYDRVKGNSTTAAQMADMMDAGGLRESMNLATDIARGSPVQAALNFVGSRLRMLGGLTPEVADNMARKLLASDPASVKAMMSELTAIEQSRMATNQKRQAIQSFLARAGGVVGGGIIPALTAGP